MTVSDRVGRATMTLEILSTQYMNLIAEIPEEYHETINHISEIALRSGVISSTMEAHQYKKNHGYLAFRIDHEIGMAEMLIEDIIEKDNL